MIPRHILRVSGALVLVLISRGLNAQSAQPWSLAGSYLTANQKVGDETFSGSGFELQARFTPRSVWSIGGGFQSTSHDVPLDEFDAIKLRVRGFFLEPRRTIDVHSDRIAPYLAGRIVKSHYAYDFDGFEFAADGWAFGGGAGFLIRATSRVNVDIGAAFVRQSFGKEEAPDGSTSDEGVKFNGYVAKAGISIGFGKR